ncbi:uncharacterized protein EI97DRAFT_372182, partial [Westerdykella ornata]
MAPPHPYYDLATRAQVIALRSFGTSIKQVEEITGVKERTQRKIITRAKEHGYQPNSVVLDDHVKDAPKAGAPRKRSASFEEALLQKVQRDRYGREKGTEQLARELTDEGWLVSYETV